jgi:hypothetical protein
MVAKLSAEKESSDDCHAIEKAKSKKTKKWNLLNFNNEKIKSAENKVHHFFMKPHLVT